MWFNDSEVRMFLVVAMIVLTIVGAVLGILLFVGLPWLFELVRPWLHEVTK